MNVTLHDQDSRFKYKEEYEKFKLVVSVIIVVLTVISLCIRYRYVVPVTFCRIHSLRCLHSGRSLLGTLLGTLLYDQLTIRPIYSPIGILLCNTFG